MATAGLMDRLGATAADNLIRWIDVAFAGMADALGSSEHWLDLAGHVVRLRLAGEMGPLLRPFAHLLRAPPLDGSEPSLTLSAWDTATTGLPPLWIWNEWGERGRFDKDAGLALSAPSHMVDVGAWTLAYTLYVKERRCAWYCLPTVGALRHQRASPFHIPLSWWAADVGLQLVHGAAVGGAGGGLLITGAGGAGKSTTALACVNAGLGYAADDYCLASVGPEPVLYSVFGTGKVLPSDTWRVPKLGEMTAREGEDKAEIFINELYPERMCKAMPLRAIFVPRVDAGRRESKLEKISARECLLALAPSTIFQLPHAGARALAKMTQLVQARPSYRLHLSEDTAEVAAFIARFLEQG